MGTPVAGTAASCISSEIPFHFQDVKAFGGRTATIRKRTIQVSLENVLPKGRNACIKELVG